MLKPGELAIVFDIRRDASCLPKIDSDFGPMRQDVRYGGLTLGAAHIVLRQTDFREA
jgi:hypothetical protein